MIQLMEMPKKKSCKGLCNLVQLVNNSPAFAKGEFATRQTSRKAKEDDNVTNGHIKSAKLDLTENGKEPLGNSFREDSEKIGGEAL